MKSDRTLSWWLGFGLGQTIKIAVLGVLLGFAILQLFAVTHDAQIFRYEGF